MRNKMTKKVLDTIDTTVKRLNDRHHSYIELVNTVDNLVDAVAYLTIQVGNNQRMIKNKGDA